MKSRSSQRAHPSDISGVRRNLRLEQHDVNHRAIPNALARLIKAACRGIAFFQRFPQGPGPSVSTNQKTIVMVDDEKAYADFLSAMLTDMFECPVRTFTNPTDALAELPTLNAGVIITDYYMPQMTGFDFIERANRVAPGIPFILVTGNSLECDDHDVGPDLPLRAILSKPFSWRKLAEEIILHAPGFTAKKPVKPVVEQGPNIPA